MRKSYSDLKNQLHKNKAELIKQSHSNMTNTAIIQKLNANLETVNSYLLQANGEIQKLQTNIVAIQKANDIFFEPYTAKINDEIDKKLGEFLNKNKVPIKFIRTSEGCYCFGSKNITIKIINSKVVVRIRGGFIMLEEFLKIYSMQELMKLCLMKGLPMQYTELELEDVPPEARYNIIKEEIETKKLNELKIIPNVNANSISNLNANRISPKSKFSSRPIMDKNPSVVRFDERAITPKKNENATGNIFKSNGGSEQETLKSEIHEVMPIDVTRKKSRIVRDAIERNKSNITSEQHSLLTSSYPAKYSDKDHSPWKKNSSARKDVSPIKKKTNENYYSKSQLYK